MDFIKMLLADYISWILLGFTGLALVGIGYGIYYLVQKARGKKPKGL